MVIKLVLKLVIYRNMQINSEEIIGNASTNFRTKKNSNDMGLFMRYIINFILLFLLIFAGIEAASAENSLPFQRALYVNEWDNTFGSKENIDIVIDNAIYMNCDAIFMYVGSEYYEAVRQF